jgi:hypothetical protein
MGSSKSRGRKNQRTHKSSRGPTPRSNPVPAAPPRKVRGPWLTGMLIFIAVHAVFTAVLLISYHKTPGVSREILWAGAVVAALLEIGSAVAMWFWKRWGIYLFVASTLAAIAFGIIVYPSMLVAFHGIVPLGLLGLILTNQKKTQLFE